MMGFHPAQRTLQAKSDRESGQVENIFMRIKHNIYDHGGSKLYTEDKKGNRNLIVDTYHTKEYAIAIREFTEKWLKENA